MLISATKVRVVEREPQGIGRPAAGRSDLPIYVNGPVLQSNSISEVLRNLVLGLHRLGYAVTWESGEPAPKYPVLRGLMEGLRGAPNGSHVMVHFGDLRPDCIRPDCLATVAIECSDSFRPYQKPVVQHYLKSDAPLIMCFSEGCRQRWLEEGIPEEKLALMPLGVDPHVYRPHGPPLTGREEVQWFGEAPAEGTFVFLVAGYLQHRKGVVETLEAFCRAFPDRTDVALLVKTVPADWGQKQDRFIRDAVARHPDHPPIGQWAKDLEPWQFAALLREVGCVVNAHRMEGFGLVPLQAMACGTQSIVTRYHGPLEYATDENAWLLSVREELVPAGQRGRGVPSTVRWADYDVDELAGLMQKAKMLPLDPDAGLATAEAFTWEHTAAALVRAVEARIGRVRRRPDRWFVPGRISVMMPVRNTPDETMRRTVNSLVASLGERDFEILVFDDTSDPATVADLERLAGEVPQLRLMRGNARLGVSAARRIMGEAATGEWQLLIDSDVDFAGTTPDWPERCIAAWDQGACIVHALLTYPDGTVESAGGTIMPEDGTASKHRFRHAPVTAEVLRPCPVIYGSSCFQWCHATLLDLVQYDTELQPYYGDPDFCYSARLATGQPVRYLPAVQVVHHQGSWTKKHLEDDRFGPNREAFKRRWATQCRQDAAMLDETGALRED